MFKIINCNKLIGNKYVFIIDDVSFSMFDKNYKVDLNKVLLRCESFDGTEIRLIIPSYIMYKHDMFGDMIDEFCKWEFMLVME